MRWIRREGWRCPCTAGLDDRRGLRQLGIGDGLECERRSLDRGDGVAVAVAAVGEELPGPFEAVLPAGQAGVLGADVLDEQQLSARLQDPRRLGQGRGRVGDRAEDEGVDGGVEARVLEREPLGRRLDDLRLEPASRTLGRRRLQSCAGRARRGPARSPRPGRGRGWRRCPLPMSIVRPLAPARVSRRISRRPASSVAFAQPVVEGGEAPPPRRVVDAAHGLGAEPVARCLRPRRAGGRGLGLGLGGAGVARRRSDSPRRAPHRRDDPRWSRSSPCRRP